MSGKTFHRDAGAARLTLRIVRDPEPRTVPHIEYADGTHSSSWADWHIEAEKQRPDLYSGLSRSP